MIMNFVPAYPDIIQKILESKFKFYLAGDRYFGVEEDSSPWLFFISSVEDNTELKNWLDSSGFITLDIMASDPFLSAEGEQKTNLYFFKDTEDSRCRVYIKLVDSASNRSKIQTVIREAGLGPDMKDPGTASKIWKTAIAFSKAVY